MSEEVKESDLTKTLQLMVNLKMFRWGTRSHISTEILGVLSRMPNLETLSFVFESQADDSECEIPSSFPMLRELAMLRITNSSQLRILTGIMQASQKTLDNLNISISSRSTQVGHLSDEFYRMAKLKNMKLSLTKLELERFSIGIQYSEILPHKSLKYLVLSSCHNQENYVPRTKSPTLSLELLRVHRVSTEFLENFPPSLQRNTLKFLELYAGNGQATVFHGIPSMLVDQTQLQGVKLVAQYSSILAVRSFPQSWNVLAIARDTRGDFGELTSRRTAASR
ncbi:hypothetical protein MMC10_003847 [Thelotrema lepadinum]|nr:hypothetical protein [Thelotrema lepadinum]